MPELIEAAVAKLRTETPDLVAITGDLVDYPLYALRDEALMRLGEKDLHLIRELFAPLTCPVVYVYGNHDHPQSFHRVFGDAPRSLDLHGYRIHLFLDDEISANTAQRLYPERQRFLEAIRDPESPPQIHIQHYVIAPQLDRAYPLNYLEASSLQQDLENSGRVRLSLSGHFHEGALVHGKTGVCYSTAPAFSEAPHPIRIIEVTPDNIEVHDIPVADPSPPRPAVFLDRDGNINPQYSYSSGPEDFSLIAGVGPALARLQKAGYVLVVITNQTAVGHGFVTEQTVAAVNDRMSALLAESGVSLDAIYCRYHAVDAIIPQYRTHNPETKPSPVMIETAARELNLDLQRSYMTGDQTTDMEAGRRAGLCGNILVRTGRGTHAEKDNHGASIVVDHLPAAVDWILSRP